MFEDFPEALQALFLLLVPTGIVVLLNLTFFYPAEANQKFHAGDKAFSTFNADTVLIQQIVPSFREENRYKVLYKTKNGLLLSAEIPVKNLRELKPTPPTSAKK